ncbi:MAG: choice-of-anchor D domain-containing protein, partial [Roseiarcus sp.]
MGDVVRVYEAGDINEADTLNGSFAAHSFIVYSISGSNIEVIDNWSAGSTGVIGIHSINDIINAFAPNGNFQSAIVSRINSSYVAENVPNTIQGWGIGNWSLINTAAPGISVSWGGNGISDGENAPSSSNGTAFGSVTQGGSPVEHAFTILNTGNATLTLGSVSLPSGFSLVQGPTSIAAGSSAFLEVELNTASVGTYSGQISFSDNVNGESPFTFDVTGTVSAPAAAPGISVSWGGNGISDGENAPSSSNGTAFGSVTQGGSPLEHAFTILNTGNATLTLGSVSLPSGFSLVQGPTSIAAGSSAFLEVELNTASVGTYSGQISFSDNVNNENPFTFDVTGTVNPAPTADQITETAPTSPVTATAGAITPISGVSVTDAGGASDTFTTVVSTTNGGTVTATGTGVSNSGTHSLTIQGTLSQVDAALATLSYKNVSAGSDTVTVKTTDPNASNSPVTKSISVTVSSIDVVSETAPATLTATADAATAISNVSVTDADAGSDTFATVVTANTGVVSASGAGVSNSGTHSLTIEGTLAQVDSALATLVYSNANAGSDTVTVTTSDLANQSSATKSISVTINSADVVSETAPATLSATAGAATAISGVSVTDAGAGSDTIATVVTANTGIVTASGAGVSNSGTHSLTVQGTLTQVDAALATLSYKNANAGSDTVTVTTSDLANQSSASKSISVTTTIKEYTGGGYTVVLSSASGNAVSLFSTGGFWDTVTGSNGSVNLTSAQASVTGGGDAIIFAGGSGNAVALYSTGGSWDTVSGSNGTVYLTSAQAAVTGGGDWIHFAGGSGN